jgi:hypothetical protein
MKASRQLVVVIAALVLQLSPAFADDVITNVMSPVVSYQYYGALGTDTNSTIVSPIASYQYFDSPNASSVQYINSPLVSYLYQFITSLVPVAIHGHVTDANGVPLAGAGLLYFGISSTIITTDANGYYQFPTAATGGTYDLLVSKTGYQGQMRGLTLNANTAEQNFKLKAMPWITRSATSWAVF